MNKNATINVTKLFARQIGELLFYVLTGLTTKDLEDAEDVKELLKKVDYSVPKQYVDIVRETIRLLLYPQLKTMSGITDKIIKIAPKH
ncbi:hypothetical protein MNL76_10200 [Fervidobacterium riparium]|nr:hypothetical protein IB67_01315 [Fervidobacterium riparium]